MKKILFTVVLLVQMVLGIQLFADEVTDPIDTALKAYKDKDYKLAMDELKYATVVLQKLDAAQNQKLLPDPLKGWNKTEGDKGAQAAMSMLGGGSMTSANYTHDAETIEIQIIANSPMIATIGMMISNPMFAQGEGSEPYRYKRLKGIKQKDESQTEITLLLAGQIMIKLTGENLKNDDILVQYLDKMDMKNIQISLLP